MSSSETRVALGEPPALTHRTVLGIVDTAIIGRYPNPAYLGAVAVGGLIFTFLFWGFGFLRMGTTGLTAQAAGAADTHEIAASLVRALAIAATAGALLILLQWPIREIAFAAVGASADVAQPRSRAPHAPPPCGPPRSRH
jgi:MATE family multidrug resistance protein